MGNVAKSVKITSSDNKLQLLIDDQSIKDVISYNLEESVDGTELTIKIAVTKEVEIQVQ